MSSIHQQPLSTDSQEFITQPASSPKEILFRLEEQVITDGITAISKFLKQRDPEIFEHFLKQKEFHFERIRSIRTHSSDHPSPREQAVRILEHISAPAIKTFQYEHLIGMIEHARKVPEDNTFHTMMVSVFSSILTTIEKVRKNGQIPDHLQRQTKTDEVVSTSH